MSGAELIMQERHRQVRAEGWTESHDKQHNIGELAEAGAGYALSIVAEIKIDQTGAVGDRDYRMRSCSPNGWPWGFEWWKPTPDDFVRQLTKAGALIAAEIDRLQANAQPRQS